MSSSKKAPGAPAPTTQISESSPTSTSFNRTTTNEIPTYLTNASQDLVARGAALTNRPYEAYTGARVAEFNPLMENAFSRIGGQQVAGQIGQATGIAGLASQQALGAGAPLGPYNPYEMGGFTADKAQQYMNPYMQNVVDVDRRKAQDLANRQSALLSGQATKQNAFGGSGAALQQRALTRDTAQQLEDIQNKGMSTAFDMGRARFGTEESMREQSRQFAADRDVTGRNLQLQGAQTALQAAGQLGQLGQTQFGQEMDITQGLGAAGDVQRQREQQLLDVGHQDYLTAQKYPYEQLAFQQSLVSGVPYSTTQRSSGTESTSGGKTVSQTMATPPPAPNSASQLLGTGLAIYGATSRPGKAAGGEIKAYAGGGGISSLPDAQLVQRVEDPSLPEIARLSLLAQQDLRDRMRTPEGAPAPRSTVVQEHLAAMNQGVGTLPVRGDLMGTQTMADGGIVSFSNQGAVPAPKYVPFYQQIHNQREQKGSIYDSDFGLPPEERARRRAAEAEAKAAEKAKFNEALQADPGQQQILAAKQEFDNMTAAQKSSARGQSIKKFLSGVFSAAPAAVAPVALPNLTQPAPAAQATPAGGGIADMAREMSRFKGDGPKLAGINQPAAKSDTKPTTKGGTKTAGTGVATPQTPAGPSRGAVPTTPSADGTGISALSMIDAEGKRRIAAQEEINKLEAENIAAEAAGLDKAEADALKSGSKREELLNKRGERLKGAEDTAFADTLMLAGLAIAGGDSENFLTNVTRGATEGLKSYQARMDTLETARQKYEEDVAALHELRETKVEAVGAERRAIGKRERDLKVSAMQSLEAIHGAVAGDKLDLTKEDEKERRAWARKLFEMDFDRKTAQMTAAARATSDTAKPLTEAQRGALRSSATSAVRARINGNVMLQLEVQKNPSKFQDLVNAEFQELLKAATSGGGGGGDGAGAAPTGWGAASVE
jgi:hypothetical protein